MSATPKGLGQRDHDRRRDAAAPDRFRGARVTAPRDDDGLTSGKRPSGRLGDPDPVPDDVTAAAKSAFDSARPGKVAVLVHDSLVDGEEPAQKHVLRFEHKQLEVRVHVSVEPAGTLIQGVVDRRGPTRAALHFHQRDATVVRPVEGATFEFAPVDHGLVRISLESDREPAVWTDWFKI